MLSGLPCIDPAMIRTIPGYNVRDAFSPETDAADAQLADNMAANGFIADKPITVRIVDNVAYVIAGHRRLDAANWLNARYLAANPAKGKAKAKAAAANRPIRGVTFIPEAVQANGEIRSPVEMSYDLELSNTGKPLSPAERGANILRLRAMGETDETIAQRLGIGTRWVGDLAKLGRSDPRLKALVKAGVIPPTTAILLERAHGSETGTAIAIAAAALAAADGKPNATGKHVAEAETNAGVVAKVGGKNKKGADKRPEETPAAPTVTVIPEKAKANPDSPLVTIATLAGPFHLGKDLEERTLYDANGLTLCEMVDVGMARAMLQLAMLGWNVVRGTSASAAATEAAAASPPAAKVTAKAKAAADAKAKADAKAAADAEAAAAIAAEAAALDAAEAKAKRQAEARERVARQVAADDAKRVAAAEANRAAAAAMVAGKPIAAMAKAAAAKVTAKAKADAAKAAADALAAAEAAEAEAAALAKAEAANVRNANREAAKVAKAAAAAAALAAGKANGKAKPARK
jgi:hypothetical protein